jgi:hypothetical protein
MRFNIIRKRSRNNLQCFINLYNQSFLDRFEMGASNDLSDYNEVSTLYDIVLRIIRAICSDCISMDSFTATRMLMYGVLEASTDNIEEYLDEGCVVELAESKREILKHRFGYSDRYERLTGTEMAERLSITRRAVYQSEQILERDIRDVIKVFKVFARYCR